MRLHRLIGILLLVESRGKMKASDLAAALETSVRSIYRDIDVLAEAGIPMISAPGPSGGISLMEGYTVNLRQLHGDEMVQLYLTGMGFQSGRNSESGLKLRNALLKLEKSLPAAYQEDIRKAQNVFYFDDTPWWTERNAVPCLETLRAALWKSQKISVQYRKVNNEISSRLLLPYGLVVKQGAWYLAAYCEEAEGMRTFKCERFEAVQLLEEKYRIPAEFSLEKYWSSGEESFKQSRRAEEHYPVVLRIEQGKQELVNRLEVMQKGEEDGFLLLTVNMYSYENACLKALALLTDIEILEPPLLREYIKQKITALQHKYL
ncbi:YafY family protein [Paenibacillus sp. FSL L8-0470]|uniref:helix-turn-helix transcriptional regulator n=2 Tax=Paenibacillus TaxID=44249 RepID=UPI0030FA0073